MAVGRVKWFNEKKGFGFIERFDGNEIFVHYSAISEVASKGFRTLIEGEEVEFDLYDSPKGFLAKNVRRP